MKLMYTIKANRCKPRSCHIAQEWKTIKKFFCRDFLKVKVMTHHTLEIPTHPHPPG